MSCEGIQSSAMYVLVIMVRLGARRIKIDNGSGGIRHIWRGGAATKWGQWHEMDCTLVASFVKLHVSSQNALMTMLGVASLW